MRLQIRCENRCGFYGELCCGSDEICSTNADNHAVCIAEDSSAADGGFTKTITPTFFETRKTLTTTQSTSTETASKVEGSEAKTTTSLQSASGTSTSTTNSAETPVGATSETPVGAASSTGIPSAAKIGIGVSVPLAVILIVAAILWFFRRRRRSAPPADQPMSAVPEEPFTSKPELEGSRVMPRYMEKPELDGHVVVKTTIDQRPALAELADSPVNETAIITELPGDHGTATINMDEAPSQEEIPAHHGISKEKETFLADPWRWSQPLSTPVDHAPPK